MERQIALVTGANSGMGLATVLALAEKDIFVVMLCRDRKRGQTALHYMTEERGYQHVALMVCDLGSMADIRRVSAAFRAKYPKLDILINNAGVLHTSRRETIDGMEAHFGICHIGHFLLTNLLRDCMGKGSRIVMVGSVAHKVGHLDFDDLHMKKGYRPIKAYGRAKLCNLLFTKELSRRLAGTGITINCVHPGLVITNIGAKQRKSRGLTMVRKTFGTLLRPFTKNATQGAKTAIYVATSPACEGISGQYYVNLKTAKPSPKANDKGLAKALWDISEAITGINTDG